MARRTTERNTFLDINEIARVLSGKRLSSLEVRNEARLEVHFSDGSNLVIEGVGGKLSVDFVAEARDLSCPVAVWPTARQREYLEFITRYVRRFGRSPAESDIQRHFLVSGPSVNHMVQELERRGFITRQRGTPRSIRVLVAGSCWMCGGTHHMKPPDHRRPTSRRA